MALRLPGLSGGGRRLPGLRCREDYTLYTALSPAEAAAALRRHVGGSSDFVGTVTEEGFSIVPRLSWRNSWLPRMRGEFRPLPEGGCAAVVRVRVHWFTRVFMAVWYAFLSAATLAMIGEMLVNGWRWVLLTPAGFWAWGWGLGYIGFHRPARRAKDRLCAIWGASD